MSWIPQQRLLRPRLLKTFDLTPNARCTTCASPCSSWRSLAAAGIRRSRSGRALVALRDNEAGVEAYGVNVIRTKLMAFALSGFLAAMAGCLLVHINQAYTEKPFTADREHRHLHRRGGRRPRLAHRGGARCPVPQRRHWFLTDKWRLLPSAIGVLVVLMVFPGGLGSLLYRGRDAALRRLARAHHLVVPSLMADSATDSNEPLDVDREPLSAGRPGRSTTVDPDGRPRRRTCST